MILLDVKENTQTNKGHAHDSPWQDQEDSAAKFVNNHNCNTCGKDLKQTNWLHFLHFLDHISITKSDNKNIGYSQLDICLNLTGLFQGCSFSLKLFELVGSCSYLRLTVLSTLKQSQTYTGHGEGRKTYIINSFSTNTWILLWTFHV